MEQTMGQQPLSELSLLFYARYALRSLRRGGQRTVLALICIAFGVMSLVAMQSLAALFTNFLVTSPQVSMGGDLWLNHQGDPLTNAQISQLAQLHQSGQLTAYTLVANSEATMLLKPEGTGHAYVLGSKAIGVDPTTYPLVGSFTLRDKSQSLASALSAPNSAVLTRDIADRLGLKVGVTFTLSSVGASVPTAFRLTAIADKTPDSTGNSVFINLDGAHRLGVVPSMVLALLSPQAALNINSLTADLKKSGWRYEVAAQTSPNDRANVNLFDFMFKGAGILGLVIGGIGVVNTLQVMLARRTLEIAVLKTIGYRERDLLLLFGIELLFLGIMGTALGALAAVGLSAGLIGLLSQTASLLIAWSLDVRLLAGGIAAGLATTLIFGIFAVLQASNIRPALLLRAIPRRLTVRTVVNAIGLFGLLTLLFVALCTLIMGTLLEGIQIVGVAFAGMIGLGIAFGVIMFVLIRLPAPKIGVLTLARNNMKRQQIRAIYALVALFAGVFTIGFASMVISSASARFAGHGIATDGDNLAIFGHVTDQAQITDQLAKWQLKPALSSYEVPVQAQISGITDAIPALLDGRDLSPTDVTLTGGAWGSTPDAVYVPANIPIPVGSTLTVSASNGTPQTLTVVGSYTTKSSQSLSVRNNNLIVSKVIATELGGSTTALLVISDAPTDQLTAIDDALGKALPTLTVVSLADVNDAVERNFRNFFLLAIAIAGLALVAGAVLIANSVGLAMVERRREMGILKAIGYSSSAVLNTILLEQGLLGILAGIIGMGAVAVAVALIDRTQDRAQIAFNMPQAILMIGVALLIALGSTLFVAWSPTHLRPLAVLRDE